MTTTTQSGSEQTTGLTNDALRKVQSSAAKMAVLGRNAKPVGTANLKMPPSVPEACRQEAEEQRQRSKRHAALLQTKAPLRHLRNKCERGGKWGVCCSRLEKMLGSGFTVVLLGEKGTGKTQMATELIRAVVRRALEADRTANAYFASMMQFWMTLKESFRSDGPTESATVAAFAAHDFLILDEAHRRSDSQYFQDLLDEMLNERYNAMKDTLLMTTLEPAAFAKSVGQAIYQRIAETGLEIECDWPSFRDPDRRIAHHAAQEQP